ncbi:hypothetical protein [Novimethylophilus kurashikiensis]|nr:hypothetical protein [Novimethylophilus kurashikiensis]
MYSDDDLASAVEAGVMTADTADAFRAHVAGKKHMPAVDEEHFRLVTGFNDIFVVIACLLLLVSVGWIGATAAPWIGSALAAGTAWLLAEFFVRQRRMALPAIVLLLAFVGNSIAAVHAVLNGTVIGPMMAGALAAGAAWLHWKRFRVPITVAAGMAVAVGGVVMLMWQQSPDVRHWVNLIALGSGVIVFGLAMMWDAADPERKTRKSDVAFWLHLLAAPLLVHPVFAALNIFGWQISLMQAGAVIALYVGIGLVSLAIDRRALMVSALGYVLYAFSSLLKLYGVVSLGFAITALAIGSALLLLSAFWHPCRAYVLNYCPAALRRHLAPVR